MPQSSLRNTLLTALTALVFGFLGAAIWSYAGLADNRTRAFLLSNPDMLPQMVEAYEAQEAEKRLADLGDAVFTPFPGVMIGNPQGTKVLVEFTDYNCPYCAASLKDVNRLVAEDPDLKVVIREWPIFEGSDAASRMALAAGLQGKYRAFHDAMFRLGDVRAAAVEAGLDMARAEADAASDAVSAEIASNLELARALGFSGTPAWIAGRKPIGGAVGYDRLKAALDGGSTG
ncbi:DsbA family protein [Erythrobacter dokdonensis]|uniref:Outer membrane protein n=1 Tax=Erythrobacter dokdonensis DSW-74 TaxID=1300349 RepID=A0A1A7BEE6_9SPHN|nr:DsbA family protein [Erythrobacter dokdonensis]OBV10854.1 outer membrane protein [Erythrobacter dokdonensis DSW-74]